MLKRSGFLWACSRAEAQVMLQYCVYKELFRKGRKRGRQGAIALVNPLSLCVSDLNNKP
jgi:hypothetical protein